MNQLAEAIIALKYAVDCVEGKILSIELDKRAREELNRFYRESIIASIENVTKFVGIEIKKGSK